MDNIEQLKLCNPLDDMIEYFLLNWIYNVDVTNFVYLIASRIFCIHFQVIRTVNFLVIDVLMKIQLYLISFSGSKSLCPILNKREAGKVRSDFNRFNPWL